MPRAKGGPKTHQRRKKVLKKAKGYVTAAERAERLRRIPAAPAGTPRPHRVKRKRRKPPPVVTYTLTASERRELEARCIAARGRRKILHFGEDLDTVVRIVTAVVDVEGRAAEGLTRP